MVVLYSLRMPENMRKTEIFVGGMDFDPLLRLFALHIQSREGGEIIDVCDLAHSRDIKSDRIIIPDYDMKCSKGRKLLFSGLLDFLKGSKGNSRIVNLVSIEGFEIWGELGKLVDRKVGITLTFMIHEEKSL